jgi:uncharacterized protein (TIGR03437 family)
MLNSIGVRRYMRTIPFFKNKGRLVTILVALPMLVFAYDSGPDPNSEGGPGGPAASCTQSGCHTGTAINAGGGKVELQFPDGLSYTPGQKQRIKVVITDTSATTRAYGYQVSARLASNETRGQAGTFSTVGSGQVIICQSGSTRPAAGACPASNPLEFIEHSRPSTVNTIEFDWTPPAAASAGNVRFYVAGNAANLNGQNTGDKIYTANYTLTPKAVTSNGPAITPTSGVTNGASFAPGVVSGSWTTVFGTNLSSSTRDWSGAIDAAGNFPTALDGVSVTIDGKPAFIYYASPNQLNIQAPDLGGKTGPVPVIVKTAAGESAAYSAIAAKELPGLFTYSLGGKTYPAAVRLDAVVVGPPNTAGVIPAKPGEMILFFGTGFGPTNPAVASGKVFSGAAPLVDNVLMRIGGTSVTPAFAGLSSSGLYQFNVTIPNLANGEHAVEMTINSVSIPTGIVLAVQR